MTSRERVQRALDFKTPDRAPRDLWALLWVSRHQAVEMAGLQRRFPMDFAGCGVAGPSWREKGVTHDKGDWTDEWGCTFTSFQEGTVGEVKNPPLGDWAELDRYQPPWEILTNNQLEKAKRAVEKNLAGEKKYMRVGTGIRPFERMQFLRGSENLYVDLGYETKEMLRLLEMLHEFNLKELELAIQTGADAITYMDDWGSQQSLLISPAQWRRLFKPLYKQYNDIAHKAGMKVFFHTDGWVFDIYPDFVELGMDAVNSQLFCMDIEEIGRRFQGKVTFWGEVSRQDILPFGTALDVRKAVARVRKALDKGAGGVIAHCEWGIKNPPENIIALFDSWDMPLADLLDMIGA